MGDRERVLDLLGRRGQPRGALPVYDAAADQVFLDPYAAEGHPEPRRRGRRLVLVAAVVVTACAVGIAVARAGRSVETSTRLDQGTIAVPAPPSSSEVTDIPDGDAGEGERPVTPMPPLTRCDDLPLPWTASVGVELNEDTRTLWLTWNTFEQAWVSLDDLDCASQPGLREFVQAERAQRDAQRQQDEANLR